MHENLILHTAAGIGGQPHLFVRLKRGNPFNQTNGSNGNQIVLISGLYIIFFENVGNQAKIMFHQFVPGFQVSIGKPF